jgi:hypothetical protein
MRQRLESPARRVRELQGFFATKGQLRKCNEIELVMLWPSRTKSNHVTMPSLDHAVRLRLVYI